MAVATDGVLDPLHLRVQLLMVAPLRKVPAPVVSIGCFVARDVFTEAIFEKFELKYVRSTRVDELYVRAPVTLGTRERTTFWLSMSFSCDLDSVPVKSSCNVALASDATAWMPVPTVTVEGFQSESMVSMLDPEAVRGATTTI